ncbi:unnamed protein product [Ectocarpus sp. CCAP 1310/34]|nr:unnamed protein product [Ectocarpus sp. CCAP 1310/34]
MAPSAPKIAWTFTFAIGSRSGDSFNFQSPCSSSRWPSRTASHSYPAAPHNNRCCSRQPAQAAAKITAVLAARHQGGVGDAGDENRNSHGDLPGRTAADTADAEAAEALRRQVFANEKGFEASSVFNPTRAREEREEEEARALAAQWGSTPERAKEIVSKTIDDKDLSFQELQRITEELNMSDEQQRAFMLQASMKKLSAASRLPKRPPPDRVKEVLNERVFASEKGFLQNSADFKNKMKVGSRVNFDSYGLPVADERDPVIQAARETTKANQRAAEKSGVEGITFPSLPDCPRCSMPTTEDELSRFDMCSQCKAQDISSKAYAGPQMASKYTYDNGDAPFSSSWTSPGPPSTNGGASTESGKTAEVLPQKLSEEQSSSSAPRYSNQRRPPPPSAPIDPRRADPPPSWPSGDNDNDRGEAPTGAAGPLRKGNGNLRSTTGSRSHRNLGNSAPDAITPPSATATGSTVAAASVRRHGTPGALPRPTAAAAAPAENTAVDSKRSSNTKVGGGSDIISPAPGPFAARASKGGAVSRDRPRGGGSDGDVSLGDTKGNGRAEVAVRKLSLEVAELRTLLGINRSTLARVETMSKSATAPQTTTEGRGTASNNEVQRRDTAVQKLARDVAELRAQLSTVVDKVSDSSVTPPRGRGGDSEVVQTMKREMAELRSQLDNARKETALTRSALRRLQGEVDVLQKKSAGRR